MCNVETLGLRMACGLDEVEASMDTVVDDLCSVDTVLLLQVGIEARLDVFDDRLPAGEKGGG